MRAPARLRLQSLAHQTKAQSQPRREHQPRDLVEWLSFKLVAVAGAAAAAAAAADDGWRCVLWCTSLAVGQRVMLMVRWPAGLVVGSRCCLLLLCYCCAAAAAVALAAAAAVANAEHREHCDGVQVCVFVLLRIRKRAWFLILFNRDGKKTPDNEDACVLHLRALFLCVSVYYLYI